jgi:hypothetical protein
VRGLAGSAAKFLDGEIFDGHALRRRARTQFGFEFCWQF